MGLDYKKTHAAFREELDKLGRLRVRIADRLACVDQRIDAISSAAEAFERAFSVKMRPAPVPPVLTPLASSDNSETKTADAHAGFEITASIREILQEGNELSAPAIRDALVLRGWEIKGERYKNPLAVVHEVLNRLIKNGDVAVTRDRWSDKKLFYDERMAADREEEDRRARAEKRAYREKIVLARAETRSMLIHPCLKILRAYPKGASATKVYRELRKMGVDMSCYKRPTSAIAFVLTEAPDVRNFKVDSDGVIRTYYQIVAAKANVAE